MPIWQYAPKAVSPTVFFAVLLAALMHASWNAVVRLTLDRFAAILLLALSQGMLALAALPFVPAPMAAAWPYIAGAALLHTGYKLFLIRAYAHGDFSQIYPLARGVAPLLVAAVGALLFGERLDAKATLAVLTIGGGVVMMAGGAPSAKGVAYALGTAAFTAAYTLADAAGARMAGHAVGFAMWMFVVDGVAMGMWAIVARGPALLVSLRPVLGHGLIAGALSLGSYSIVIWAFTRAPIALVAALRETSVVFAMIIAAFLLKENVSPRRWAAALLIAVGVAALRL